MEVDLDGESDLDVTEVRHVLPAIRETQMAQAGAGAGGVAEGDSPASSVSSGRADNGSSSTDSSNCSSSSSCSSSCSSSSNGSNSSSSGSSSSSSSNNGNGDDRSGSSSSSGDVPALTGLEAHRQRWEGKIPALQGGRTRSQSRQYQMSADTADALLARAQRTVEQDTAIERVHDVLLEGRLEEEHEWLGEIRVVRRRWAAAVAARGGTGLGLPLRNGGRTKPRAKYSVSHRKTTQRRRVAPTLCSGSRTVCVPKGLGGGHEIRVRWPY